MIFLLYVRSEDVPVGAYLFLLVERYGKDDDAVTRNGVVHLSAIELCQTNALILLHLLMMALRLVHRPSAMRTKVIV